MPKSHIDFLAHLARSAFERPSVPGQVNALSLQKLTGDPPTAFEGRNRLPYQGIHGSRWHCSHGHPRRTMGRYLWIDLGSAHDKALTMPEGFNSPPHGDSKHLAPRSWGAATNCLKSVLPGDDGAATSRSSTR